MSLSSSNASTLTSSPLPSRICNCGLEAILKTSFTEANFGRHFFSCVNYKYDKPCGYFYGMTLRCAIMVETSEGQQEQHRLEVETLNQKVETLER
ncbi:hypothetical protein CJ030_MR7G021991 [Morella rubra]|uniref:GRF-type domain-containing protein n=1 Tax=Morella rubra TaxID=262757 RepID=A0A6A1UXY9_9ROSI|nr:hypothetical protein CJ030_MR7G021991 [Morella rubra]